MSISSIGIMQGRILPRHIDQLQIFPSNTWHEEFSIAENIGFQHIELLWDSKKDIKNAKRLIHSATEFTQLHVPSMCVDSICSCESLRGILNEILDVINTFKENTPSVLVIPLLDRATVNTVCKLKEFINEANVHKIWNLLQKYDIKLALELDMPVAGVVEAIKCIDSNLIGICLDSGNLWHYSDSPINDIRALSDKIIHVHIKDRDKEGENVLLGKGLVDFNLFFKVLEDIGYSNAMTLETKYFKNPPNEARKNLQYILKMMQ
jgi:L-ribulose-5-phosphate 3-epimerase